MVRVVSFQDARKEPEEVGQLDCGDGYEYSINSEQSVLKRLTEKYGKGLKIDELPSVCEYLGYPLCSFEIDDAKRVLTTDANGVIACKTVAAWFSNIDKAYDISNESGCGAISEQHKALHSSDPTKLHHFIRELHSMRTQIDGEIGKLQLMQTATSNQLETGIDKLDSIFESGYDLYDDLKKIDKILEDNKSGLNNIILGTSGLTKILEVFLKP